MRKIISLVMALCLIMAISACSPNDEPTTTPTTEPTTNNTEPTPSGSDTTDPTTEPTTALPTEPVIYDLPMTAISMTEQAETVQNNDGTTIFEYTYQNIRLLLPDAELSHSINMDILNRIDSTRSAADSVRTDALNMGVGAVPFSYHVRYTPQRIDNGILSLLCITNSYTGGAHGGNSCSGLTYDLTTGTVLTLADVLTESTTADVICRLTVDALSARAEELYLYDDFHLYVEDRFSGDFLADESWHLSDEGLCFTFAPYEIAPNSAGFVQAVIPYEQLTGILEDNWFPEERVTPNGQLEVSPFIEDNTDGFDQFAELYLDQMGGSYLLHSTGLIYDLIIETGFWNMNGTEFTPDNTVFRACSLVSSDAVRVMTDIPDVLPNLRITYTGAQGTVTVYLSASGEDGSPLLLIY